jgi:sulfide:quinone oxidoreductase
VSKASRSRVVVAGGGPAALEAALTLGERLRPEGRELFIVAPNAALIHRPLSAVAEFATHPPHELSLGELASSLDASLVRDRVVLVDEAGGRLLTGDGDWLDFDSLLLAVGTRERPLPAPWVRWPSGGDPELLRGLVAELRTRSLRVAVVVPARAGWALAGYELALLLAYARDGEDDSISLLTEAKRPLAMLGSEAEDQVRGELDRAGVEVCSGAVIEPRGSPRQEAGADSFSGIVRRMLARRGGTASGSRRARLRLDAEPREFDLVLALPVAIGPDIGGVRADEHGFVSVDEGCRALGSERVWAAGDCTGLPLKHSTLAVAQADAAADALAAAGGASLDPTPFKPVLSGILVSGLAERWPAETAGLPEGLDPATHCLWWPPGQVLGGRLARYVSARDPAALPLLLSHPPGMALRVELSFPSAAPSAGQGDAPRSAPAQDPDAESLLLDVYARRVRALERVEREAEARLEQLEAELARQRAEGREVLNRLNAAGYLVKDERRGERGKI